MTKIFHDFSFLSLHILAGVYPELDNTEKDQYKTLWRETYIQNLRYASQRVALVCTLSLWLNSRGVVLRVRPVSAVTGLPVTWDRSYDDEHQTQLHWHYLFCRQRNCDLCLLHHRDSSISSSCPSSLLPFSLWPFWLLCSNGISIWCDFQHFDGHQFQICS